MGLRKKIFDIMGVHWKIQSLGGFTKNQCTWGQLPEWGRRLGQFANLDSLQI